MAYTVIGVVSVCQTCAPLPALSAVITVALATKSLPPFTMGALAPNGPRSFDHA